MTEQPQVREATSSAGGTGSGTSMKCDRCRLESGDGASAEWVAGRELAQSETKESGWEWSGFVIHTNTRTTFGEFQSVEVFICQDCLSEVQVEARAAERRLGRKTVLLGAAGTAVGAILLAMGVLETFGGIVVVVSLALALRGAYLWSQTRNDGGPTSGALSTRSLLYPFAWSKANGGRPYVDPLVSGPPAGALMLWSPDEFEKLKKESTLP